MSAHIHHGSPFERIERPQATRKTSLAATAAGTVLLFVTFTQGNVQSVSQFIILYLPILYICLIVIGDRDAETGQRVSSDDIRLRFILLMVPYLLAGLTIEVLQYLMVILGFIIGILALPVSGLMRRLPTYAYYAALLNAGLYLGEVILNGMLGLPFDASVFNYIGVEREGIIVHWGLNRYGGHHTEPGSFAINFAALTVLSLMGGRKPTWFHWLAVFLLAGTLSVTAALMAVLVGITILLANKITAKTVAFFAVGLVLTVVLIVQVLPLLGLSSFEFFTERFVERGGNDISIYLKELLVQDFQTRDILSTIFGNRYAECYHCSYAKSLGYGFFMMFQSGLFGALLITALGITAIWRFGRPGAALFLVFMLMRLEYHFPQALMFCVIVAGLPTWRTSGGHRESDTSA